MNELQTTNQKGFSLRPQNIQEAMKLAEMIAHSQLAPKQFAGKPADCLVAMMMGDELKLNPIQSLQNIAVINGRPCLWGDAMLALCQNHLSWGGINETFDESSMTATCEVWRKDGSSNIQTYSQRDAEYAQLWGKQGPWKQNPKRMLAMRARGFALRNIFADALLGLISREEADDYPQDAEVTSNRTVKRTADKPKAIEQMPAYDEHSFAENLPKWQAIIESGKKTADQLIQFISAKATLSDEQISMIRSLEVSE